MDIKRPLATLGLALALGCASQPAIINDDTPRAMWRGEHYQHVEHFSGANYRCTVLTKQDGDVRDVNETYVAQRTTAPYAAMLVATNRYSHLLEPHVGMVLFYRFPTPTEARTDSLPIAIPSQADDTGRLACAVGEVPTAWTPWATRLPVCSTTAQADALRVMREVHAQRHND
jgi:hypothetical protein